MLKMLCSCPAKYMLCVLELLCSFRSCRESLLDACCSTPTPQCSLSCKCQLLRTGAAVQLSCKLLAAACSSGLQLPCLPHLPAAA